MNGPEFQTQMNRLMEQFGKAAYGNERARLIWNEVKELPAVWFSKVVDQFIGELRQAPLLKDFRDEIYRERERLSHSQKSHEPAQFTGPAVYACSNCRDMGVFLCRKGNSLGSWAFRCHCSKGSSDPRKAIPQYKAGHGDDGFQRSA